MESSNSESEENSLSEQESENENQTGQEKQQVVPEYERQRQLRIQENNKRMEALGLSKIASSFKGSVEKANKNKEKKGKKKKVDEDEEYNPIEGDEEKNVSSEDEEKDSNFTLSGKKKAKYNTPTPKKRGATKKLKFDSDYVNDDDALLQAIALSLGFSDVKSSPAQSSDSHLRTNTNSKVSTSCNTDIPNADSGKKKRKKPITSRVQMSEDEIILHFFQFDEADKGGISVRDIERLASAHDFTWSDKEMNDMIYCLDSDGDGKISLDDFLKIVSRINMVKSSDNDTTAEG